ncbi:28 kDa heat- and acid-stable phosphoprotein [Drosophila takahashii]|uniref:28 kDa heat- and acid-stable phosphoprotein n=1 Tax=Drosophila takahashii TaxID=29030 RepID=UPI001CF90F18|nr:28 kDa heat- and acid-stable phosphoprotein [Drosophila takahashii]
MPRGKFVNHKGRSRHFTSPEELQQESEEESDQTSGSGSESEEKAGAASSSAKAKAPAPRKAPQNRSQKARNAAGGAASSSDSESGEDSDEDSEGEARDAKKGVASLIEIENPNRVTKKATQKLSAIKLDDGPPGGEGAKGGGHPKPELSRREREQIEKQKARQRYEKLHAAGKTTEAKADLARLALIRQQREEAAAKREAEKKAADGGAKKPGAK